MKTIRKRKVARRWGDARARCDACRPDDVAHEIEISPVAGIRQLRPLGFKEFQASPGIHDKIHFARPIAPEEQTTRSPYEALAVAKLGVLPALIWYNCYSCDFTSIQRRASC